MAEVVVHDRLAEVEGAAWDACFEGEAESYAYFRAVERSDIPGFRLFYVTVRDRGQVIAAAPGFLTDYRLDTTLSGPMKRLVGPVLKLAPGLARLKLACLGSPVTETASLGVAPGQAHRRGELIAALISGLEWKAKAERVRLWAVKDIPASQMDGRRAAEGAGLNAMSSLPTAYLDLGGIPDEEAYWSRLSAATRKDLRRKLRAASAVRTERVHDLAPHAARIDQLYAATRVRAEMTFETLSWRYFQAVLEELGDDSACFLYFVGDEVVAFNLLVSGGGIVVDKYFCAGRRGPEFNLYFVSWLTNVRYALSRRATRLVAGQACYEPKLRLGCELTPTAIYFRHRFAPLNAALRWGGRRFGMDEGESPRETVRRDAFSPAHAGEKIAGRPAKALI